MEETNETLPAVSDPETEVALQTWHVNPAAFEFTQRVAKVYSLSKLVPESYRGSLPDCIIAVNYANRLKLDPLTFMQESYVVHGKPGISAKLVIALMNAKGRYIDGVEFEYDNEENPTQCKAFGIRANGKVESATCTVKQAKDCGWWEKNPNWRNITAQMLAYRAASFLARKYCPDILLGLDTIEEQHDVHGVRVVGSAPSRAQEMKQIAVEATRGRSKG